MNTNRFIFESKDKSDSKKTNNIDIIPVHTKAQFRTFYEMPWIVYQNNPNWIPPFWLELSSFFKLKNPFWQHATTQLFLAKKDSKVIGRIAAFVDTLFSIPESDHIGFFGFFECINDTPAATELFTSVEHWLKSQNCKMIIGPLNGRMDMSAGFLINKFDTPPPLLCPYNPRYYPLLAKKNNMKKIKDFFMYDIDLTSPLPTYLFNAMTRCKKEGVVIRRFSRWRTGKELRWWVKLFKDIFTNHWGYVPVSNDEVRNRFGIKQARWFVDTGFFLVAEQNGVPIAFKWSSPDYNQLFIRMNGRLGPREILRFIFGRSGINQGRLNYVGIQKNARLKGIGSCFNYYILSEMKKRGYVRAMSGPMDETNIASIRTIEKTGAKQSNVYRIYQKKI